MTTHRRAWALRAGVVAALVAGSLLGVGSPASAAAPSVQITQLSSGTLGPGQRATLKFRVQNNNILDPGKKDSAQINVSSTFGELRCDGRCDFNEAIDPQQSKEFEVTLVASANVQPGQTKSGKVRITATINNETATAERDITVRGPDAAPAIRRISGTVRDQSTNDPIEDAEVTIRDSRNQSFRTRTDGDGDWAFTSSQERPIAPGEIAITIKAEGYRDTTKNRNVGNGQSLTGIKISMASTAAPTASPTADPTTEPPSEEPVPTEEPTGEAINPASGEQDSGGTLSWMLIILGGLLVALGVGAIVLLLVRRKEDADADEMAGAPAGGGPQGATPGSRGAYHGAGADPTRVTNRAGMGADPTMFAAPGLADAPTMMQRAVVEDEYPDPYGAPLPGRPPQPGWGDTNHGINGAPHPGFGAPTPGGYGSPVPPGAGPYAAPGSPSGPGGFDGPGRFDEPGGFDGPGGRDFGPPSGYPDRYDEPTGMFNGGAAGYGKPGTRPYEPEPYGGGGPGGHGGGYEPRDAGYDDGYGGGAGFEPPRGGYEAPADGYGRPPGGYDDGYEPRNAGFDSPRPAYDAPGGGYEPRGGYDQDAFDRGSDRGYEPRGGDRGYYDEPGGGAHSRHGAPPAGRSESGRGERRPLDWLDD